MPTNINFNKRLGVSGGNNITLPSSVPTFADTKSFQFDGALDRFEGVGTYSQLDGLKKATFSFWLKPALTTTDIQFAIMNGSEPQVRLLMYTNGIVRMNFLNGGYYTTTPIGSITANVWSHVLFCFDKDSSLGNAGRGQVFINGVYVPGQGNNLNNAAFGVSTSGIYIGSQDTSLTYQGFINELAIWAGEDLRSASDVAEIYNGGVPNDLNSLSTVPQPTTWQRMGEDAVWDGSKFVMTDVNGGYVNTSIGLLPTDPNPTTDVPLFNNKSFTYDGSLDFVSMGDVLNMANDGTDSFSYSLWFKTTDTGSHQMFISKNRNSVWFNGVYFSMRGDLKILQFGLGTAQSNQRVRGKTGAISDIRDGNWHHVCLTYDGSQLLSGFNLYYDNNPITILIEGPQGTPNNVSTVGQADLLIGSRGLATSNAVFFNGNMDDVSYFTSELSASDVNTIYGTGVPNDISSLNPVGWWRAEKVTFDGTNWTLIDQGSGSNNGTSSSMPFTSRSSDVPT